MHIGNPKIRRWIAEHIPIKRVKRCIQLVDYLDNVTRDILARKKTSLASGDEAFLEQVDQGKDLMSVLREFSSLGYRIVRPSLLRIAVKANTQAAEGDKMSDAEFLGHMWCVCMPVHNVVC